jgi:hypothetical protein
MGEEAKRRNGEREKWREGETANGRSSLSVPLEPFDLLTERKVEREKRRNGETENGKWRNGEWAKRRRKCRI